MTSEIKQNLNKHELILERYKNILFLEKNKSSNQINNNTKNPINEITSKTLKIKENIDLRLNVNPANQQILDKTNLSKTEKKIDEILNKANYTVFENTNVNKSTINIKNLSSSEQVKKIKEENNKIKLNNANNDKISSLIKKYETIDNDNRNLNNLDHKNYLENLKLDQQAKNINLNNIIEKNNNLIENLKRKYLNNIKQNSSSLPSYSHIGNEIKFPLHKHYKENEVDSLSSSGNSLILENLKTKAYNTINVERNYKQKINDEVEFDNQDNLNKINLLREKYIKDERPKSSMDINKLFKEETFPIKQQDSLISKDPEINSIINKYRNKLGSSNSIDLAKENEHNNINAKLFENPENCNFEKKFEEVNKKIEGINFSYGKNSKEFLKFPNKNDEENNKINDQDFISEQIINKKIEKEKNDLVEKEKSKFDFIFKNKENIADLLFKFKLKEKFSLDEDRIKHNYQNSEYSNNNNKNGEEKDKKGFIKKINFIEEKLSRIENLINFEEKEIKNINKFENRFDKDENKGVRKMSNENENYSDYPENFTLENIKFNNEIKNVKKSVFNELNKNDDLTTDDEKQSNNILSFAQNIRKLKELKEKNNQMIEEIEEPKISKQNYKAMNIPLDKKKKAKKR